MLFGVSAGDPVTLALVVFVLVTVAAVAGYVPARRAMRVDPVVALRHQ
jgi:ABC-type lipoprotein release transport system permease subunit